MIARRLATLLGLALAVLPGCFDPIVGSECKTGYSPCHGLCVPTGACRPDDAIVDGAVGDASTGDDAAEDDGAPLGAPEDAGVEDEVGGGTDGPLAGSSDGAPVDDGPSASDAAADDFPGAGDVPDDATDAPADAPLSDDLLPSGDAAPIVIDADDAAAQPDDVAGPPKSNLDGGVDADDTSDGLDANDDAQAIDGTNPGDTGVDDAGPLVCAETQMVCSDQCIDPLADPKNCGGCNNACDTGVCISGTCLVCETQQSVCGQQCVNLATDPDNCGGCGVPCMSGLCSNGQCEAAGTGRVIVIGHDYYKNRSAMNRVLGNAVFLWPVNPVRLLTYPGDADPVAIAGATTAITQVATATGRRADSRAAVTSADVPGALASTDVFLVYGQARADDATLAKLGQDWKSALTSFVQGGGTMIVLDAVYTGNNGTVQILSQAGLFDITRASRSTGDTCGVVARSDALATGLSRTYLCEANSTTFSIGDTSTAVTTVVTDVSADSFTPVVIHKPF